MNEKRKENNSCRAAAIDFIMEYIELLAAVDFLGFLALFKVIDYFCFIELFAPSTQISN
jgi:hypothetical protein